MPFVEQGLKRVAIHQCGGAADVHKQNVLQ